MEHEPDTSAEDRVRAALRTLADEANQAPTRPLAPHTDRDRAARHRLRYPLAAAAAAAAVGIAGVGILLRDTPDDVTVDPAITTTTGATSSTMPTSTVPTSTVPTSTVPTSWPSGPEMEWAPMADAPIDGRIGAGAVWTGTELLVWGGVARGETVSTVSDGAAYDPTTNTWRAISPAPDGLIGGPGIATAWTGDVAVFWAGNSPDGVAAGATYDPVADSWQTIDPGPLGPREGFTSVWTGSELVIIGGVGGDQVAQPVGAAFDPNAGTWRSLPALDDHFGDLGSGLWTGREILRHGQRLRCPELGSACADSEPFLSGYDPATDTYRDITLGPDGTSIGAGSRPVGVAGTEAFFENLEDPGAGLISYDLAADAWSQGDPAPCEIADDKKLQTVWLDERWVIPCGGEQLQIYDTRSRTWTVVAAGESPLNNRSGSQTAWTGRHLIVWSGAENGPGTPTPNDGRVLSLGPVDPTIIDLRGIGPIRIGMSFADLTALGYEITYADCEVPYIQLGADIRAAVPKGDDTVNGLYFWFDPDNPDQPNSRLRTAAGIGAGSTRADVLAAYGAQVVEQSVEIEDYDPDVSTLEHRIELIPSDPADRGLVMIFSFHEDGTLSGIRTGEASAVHEPHLCA